MSNLPENEEFDPYRIWLSIPKAEQPPHHYRLLGLSPFESDFQVIQEAADRQVAHLKTKQTGARVALSQALLTEVSAAAGVLLHEDSKAKYDQKLRATLGAAAKAKTAALPQARSLPVQPLPMPQQYQQPQYQQPGYAQPGYQQPNYQQPGYQQPGYQQPGYQQPGYAPQPGYQQSTYPPSAQPSHYTPPQPTQYQAPQPLPPQPAAPQPVSHQQPQPNRPQPLRPVAISQPVEDEPASVSISVDSSFGDGTTSSPGDRPRRKDNTAMEIVKVIVGGGAGLLIGAIVLMMIGKSDFLYGIAGMSPPAQVTQVPKQNSTTNGSGPKKTNGGNSSTSNPRPNNGTGATTGTNGQSTSESNNGTSSTEVPSESGSNPMPNPATQTPVPNPLNNPGVSPSNVAPNNGSPSTGNPERVMQPSSSVAAKQSGVEALRESLNFLSLVYSHLEKGAVRPEHKALMRDQGLLVRQILGNTSALGPLPAESGLLAYRKSIYTLLEGVDRQAQSRGVNQIVSGKLLANLCLTIRPDADPQGRMYKPNGVDEFPQKLLEYADGMLTLSQKNRAIVEAHDRLCYLAMMAQILHYSYLRGNADQLSTCVVLDAVATETATVLPNGAEILNFKAVHNSGLKAAGFASLGGDLGSDPRTSFRGASTFIRQQDGKWFEHHPNRGLVVYTERDRTPAAVELMSQGQPPTTVRLALGWSVTTQLGRSGRPEEAYAEGDWQFSKPQRSLVPKLVISFPGNPANSSVAGIGNGPIRYPNRDPLPGTPITSTAQVKAGDRVHILWGQEWWPGTVTTLLGTTQVRIHYDNHDASSDEFVTLERVRLMNGGSGMGVATLPGMQPGGPNPGSFNPGGFNPGTAPAPVSDAKKLWRHSLGYIEYDETGWRELAPTGDYFTLSIISQTDEVVEVERTTGGVRLRLYDNRCEYALSPYTQYTEACKGSWSKRIEDVELDAAQAGALKRTCDTYLDAVSKARKNLDDRFESNISSIRKRIGKAEDRLATIALLEEERSRFERDGLVPWSQPMKSATADYMTALNRARGTAEGAFDRAIDYFVNHSQPEVAHSVLVLKQKTLAPMVIARLIPRDAPGMAPPRFGGGGNFGGGMPDRTIPPGLPADVADRLMRERGYSTRNNNLHRLWSNGNLDDAFGASKWLANNSGVGLSIIRSSSTVRDVILISEKGDEFAAQSSQGSSYSYQGTFASSLEPYEKRPDVKFNPKIKAAAAVKTEPAEGAKPEEPKPAEPATPAPTTPAPTVPAPTVPAPTVPAPTVPAPTVPAPTTPAPAAPVTLDPVVPPAP